MRGLLPGMARLLLLPILITGIALSVKGYSGVGDGFSGGVIAALGIVLQYVALGAEEAERTLPLGPLRWAGPAGLLLVLAVALGPALLAGEPPVTLFPRPDAQVIRLGLLELHTSVLFDGGIFLIVLGFGVGIGQRAARMAEEEEPG